MVDWISAIIASMFGAGETVEEILEEVLIKPNKMLKEGELDAYLKHHDQNRKNTGQFTFSISRK